MRDKKGVAQKRKNDAEDEGDVMSASQLIANRFEISDLKKDLLGRARDLEATVAELLAELGG